MQWELFFKGVPYMKKENKLITLDLFKKDLSKPIAGYSMGSGRSFFEILQKQKKEKKADEQSK